MKRTILAPAALLLSTLTWFAPGPSATPDRSVSSQEAAEEQSDPLHESMEALNDGLRQLRGLLRGDDVDAMLPVLDAVQAAVVVGKGQVPYTVEAVPEDQRAAFVRDFRSEQLLLLDRLVELERLILAGDLEAANTWLAEEVMAMKRPSHNRFKSEGGWSPR